ncbi:MAG: MFS transporter [Bacteroidetes bacterium]|nr:MAG: MFS transporter [Bacteroidota bacterium]
MNNRKIVFWSVTVSLGGFLFGFDTALISGVEGTVQQLWSLSDAMTGQLVAMALYGTIIGAIFGGMPAQYMGRKKTLYFIAAIYLFSALGSALAPDISWLMFFRFFGGLSVGASSVVAPMYIAEISPGHKRGRLTALFQFNIVFGILIAYFSNWLIGIGSPDAWRWMLGVEAFPALLFLILVYFVPESPRWLVLRKNDMEEALRILAIIDPVNAEQSLEEIRKGAIKKERAGLREFFSGIYRFPILLAFLFAFFNQVSGINAVIYYAPRIFEASGMGVSSALLSSVGIGLTNLLFTILGMALIDRMGRRFLMYVGSFGYIISLGMVAWVFSADNLNTGLLLPVLLFVFIAAHAIGQGAVIWVFISEIFPNRVRSWGNSLGSTTHWLFAAIIAGNFPWFAGKFGQAPIFGFFAIMMVLQLLFVWKIMPETKGSSLEHIEQKMIKRKD